MAQTKDDIDAVARTVFWYARNDSDLARASVARALTNRVAIAKDWMAASGAHRHPRFGDGTFAGACYAVQGGNYEFPCHDPADPYRINLQACSVAVTSGFAACQSLAEWLAGAIPVWRFPVDTERAWSSDTTLFFHLDDQGSRTLGNKPASVTVGNLRFYRSHGTP